MFPVANGDPDTTGQVLFMFMCYAITHTGLDPYVFDVKCHHDNDNDNNNKNNEQQLRN